jgi:hypothetical protein
MYFEKKLKEIEMKIEKCQNSETFFDFSDSNHTRLELQTGNHNIHYHQILVFP